MSEQFEAAQCAMRSERHEAIVRRFLSDEYSNYTVLTEMGREYGATNVAIALRAELQAAREFCREASQRSEFLQHREKFTAEFQLAALRDDGDRYGVSGKTVVVAELRDEELVPEQQ